MCHTSMSCRTIIKQIENYYLVIICIFTHNVEFSSAAHQPDDRFHRHDNVLIRVTEQ